MFDLISIGDAAVDHFFEISDAHVKLNKGVEELCLRFGDKLPVEKYHLSLGGNNPNTSRHYDNKNVREILRSYNPPHIVPRYAEQVISIMNAIGKEDMVLTITG